MILDGIETTRYDLTVKPGTSTPLQLSGPIGLWVDSENRVRQLHFTFKVPDSGQITDTLVYSHFGMPLHIEVVPVVVDFEWRSPARDLPEW